MKRCIPLLLAVIFFTSTAYSQSSINTFPYVQNFETFPQCATTCGTACTLAANWTNEPVADDIDWTADVGGTGSFNTGPAVDHTTGTATGTYLYTEASGCALDEAHLISPEFDFTGINTPRFEFWYHMFGATMGTLHVDVSTNNGSSWNLDVIPAFTDNQNIWQEQDISLANYANNNSVIVRLRAITGTSFTSDITIDDIRVFEGPVNDFCNNAITITCDSAIAGTTVEATIDNVGTCGTSTTAPGLWYKITGTGGSMTATLCGNATWDTKLSVFAGNCSLLTCVDGNDDACGLQSEVNWSSTFGTEYYILVHGFGANTGIFTLDVNSAQANDDCANATVVTPGSYSGSTACTGNDFAPACGTAVNGNLGGVWYQLQGTGNHFIASLCQSNYDTQVRVYSGTCGLLTCVEGNDQFCGDQSQVDWCSVQGTTYFILIHGTQDEEGAYTLNLLESPIAQTTITPNGNVTLCAGDSITFTSSASNNVWSTGDTSQTIQVGTASIVSVTGLDPNGCASASLPATVTVQQLPNPPVVTEDSICGPGTVTLGASGNSDYEWFDSPTGGTLVGTGSTFTTATLSGPDTFYVAGTNTVTSSVGAVDNNIGTGSNYTALNTFGLLFEVYQDMTWDSVTVYPNSPGTVEVRLMDASGTIVLMTTSVNVSVGGFTPVTIPVGFNLSPGNYRVDAGNTSTGGLYRNNGGPAYPYELPGVMSITSPTSFNLGFYYFYYDWVVSTSTCPSVRVPVEAKVRPLPTGSISGGGGTICNGETTLINVNLTGTGPWNLTYSDGTNTNNIPIVNSANFSLPTGTAGAYTITALSDAFCTGNLFSGFANVVVNPLPTALLSGADTICEDGINTADMQVDLTGTPPWDFAYSNGTSTFSVNGTGSSPHTIAVNESGTYMLTALSDANCTGVAFSGIGQITGSPLPLVELGNDTILCDSTTLTIGPGAGLGTYLWSDGSFAPTLTVTEAGTFTVTVTNGFGCVGEDAIVITADPCIPPVGIDSKVPVSNFSFYPNPTNGRLTLQFESTLNTAVEITVSNVQGKILFQNQLTSLNQNLQTEIDLTGAAAGIYFLKVLQNNTIKTGKIIVE